MVSETHQKLASSIKQFGLSLQSQHDEEVKHKHSINMQQLEELTKKLQGTLKGTAEEKEEAKAPYVHDFTMTRGYNQSQQMREELKPFSMIHRNPMETKYGAHPNDIVVEEQSDFDREDNVFN